ncbi:hypothetical protein CVT25_005082 [Psilocybe cyanescens]|uniref:Uncharacterized protein n=1 Tax=Psilocybe cyanescens TaxID=93625 RepID=A0A409XDX0_PSICY|nr:hypothetical protein CVT25_005082 [Psilocybe cyanescens]
MGDQNICKIGVDIGREVGDHEAGSSETGANVVTVDVSAREHIDEEPQLAGNVSSSSHGPDFDV